MYRIILLLTLFVVSEGFSQNISVNVSKDTNNVLIGDQVEINYSVRSEKNLDVYFPDLADTIGQLEIVRRSPVDTIFENNSIKFNLRFFVTSFDSGSYLVPSIDFNYRKPDSDSILSVSSDSFYIDFLSVAVDTAKAMKDIKGPIEVDYSLIWQYIIYAIILIFILAALYFFYRYIKKRKDKPEPEPDYDPNIPSHLLALEALTKLKGQKLWQKGQTKLYYINLTEIIRKYISRRFRINALEMTSGEIISSLTSRRINPETIDYLNSIFYYADLAKFAKAEPLPDENDLAMKNSLAFVENTIPKELPAEENTDQSENEEGRDANS